MTLSDMQEEDDAMPDPDELIGAKFQKFQSELNWRAEMKGYTGTNHKEAKQPWNMGPDSDVTPYYCPGTKGVKKDAILKEVASPARARVVIVGDGSVPVLPVQPDDIPVVKHRVTGKGKAPLWVLQNAIQQVQQGALNKREKDDIRDHFVKDHITSMDLDGAFEMPHDRKREIARDKWRSMSEGERCDYMILFKKGLIKLSDGSTCKANARLPVGVQEDWVNDHANIRGFLMTFHGPWGKDLPAFILAEEQGLSSDEMFGRIRKDPYFSRLADKFFRQMKSAAASKNFGQVSISIEFCTQSEDDRIHLHCMVSGGHRHLCREFFAAFTFEGVPPSHVAFSAGMLTAGEKAKNSGQLSMGNARAQGRSKEAHYYLQFEKVGSLARRTNFHKWTDFAVKRRWISNQFQVRKMSCKTAIAEIIGSRDGARHYVAELKWLSEQERGLEDQKEEEEVIRLLTEGQKPWVPLPVNVQDWKKQYCRKNYGRLSRFKVLVLSGDTRLGKTSWAKSFFGPAKTLVLNCQNVSTPNMKEYNRQEHDCIVFDEGDWKLIHENKLLFQAGPNYITLGQSMTNCMAYNVYAYQTPMIVCTNIFWSGVPTNARKYLDQNIVYVEVTAQCWRDDEDELPEYYGQ